MRMIKIHVATLTLLTAVTAWPQDLGHEYEFEAAPIREGEKPVIPLDTQDPSYNIWRQLRDLSKDPKREPGIINVQKYDFGMSYNAMPTFFNQPIAMTPADLAASNVDIAIIGAVPDMGTGARGAAQDSADAAAVAAAAVVAAMEPVGGGLTARERAAANTALQMLLLGGPASSREAGRARSNGAHAHPEASGNDVPRELEMQPARGGTVRTDSTSIDSSSGAGAASEEGTRADAVVLDSDVEC